MQSIIIAYDGSEAARRALERVAEIAAPDATVRIVGVASGSPRGAHIPGPSTRLSDDRSGTAPPAVPSVDGIDQLLHSAREALALRGVEAKTIRAIGDPADAIIEAAAEANATLIVMGNRGHGVAKRVLLGSVSSQVVNHAPCDVLVVRSGPGAAPSDSGS